MNTDDLQIIQSDDGLIAAVRSMIVQTREGVARTVNPGMTLLYGRIGKRIQTDVLGNERAEYGDEIVATLSRQSSWSHFKEIIPLKDDLQRDFFAEMCRVERWSVPTLREKIGSMLFERAVESIKATFGKRAAASQFSGRDGKLPSAESTPASSADLVLVTWLVIAAPAAS